MGILGEVKDLVESKQVLGYIVAVTLALAIALGGTLGIYGGEWPSWLGQAKGFAAPALFLSCVLAAATLGYLKLLQWATKPVPKSEKQIAEESASQAGEMLRLLRAMSNDERELLQHVPAGIRLVEVRVTNGIAAGLADKRILKRSTQYARGAVIEYTVSDLAYQLLREDPSLLRNS